MAAILRWHHEVDVDEHMDEDNEKHLHKVRGELSERKQKRDEKRDELMSR